MGLGSAFFAAGQVPERQIPRQTVLQTAAVQGIVRNTARLGLGGVTVTLRGAAPNLPCTTGAVNSYPCLTTGDGAFRFLNLQPGSYSLSAEMQGYQPMSWPTINLKPGDVFSIEIELMAIPVPGLPTRTTAPAVSPYRTLVQLPTNEP